jgi:hypothetical protein
MQRSKCESWTLHVGCQEASTALGPLPHAPLVAFVWLWHAFRPVSVFAALCAHCDTGVCCFSRGVALFGMDVALCLYLTDCSMAAVVHSQLREADAMVRVIESALRKSDAYKAVQEAFMQSGQPYVRSSLSPQ